MDNSYNPQLSPNLIGLSLHSFSTVSEFISLLSSALSHIPYTDEFISNSFSKDVFNNNSEQRFNDNDFNDIYSNNNHRNNTYNSVDDLSSLFFTLLVLFFFLAEDPFSKKAKAILKSHIFIRIIYVKNKDNSFSPSFFDREKIGNNYNKNTEDQFFSSNNLVNNKYHTYLNKKKKGKGTGFPQISKISSTPSVSSSPSYFSKSPADSSVVLECILLAPVYQNIVNRFL
jgi:hypothetical protein